ncbi:MAG TPA: hypothetical protein VGR45_09655 [Stellaceae bacterium]|nr:hypothetical protein [Stellaceae bacterium]
MLIGAPLAFEIVIEFVGPEVGAFAANAVTDKAETAQAAAKLQ